MKAVITDLDRTLLHTDKSLSEYTCADVRGELKAFLDYVAGQKPEDSYVEKLEEAVQEAKKNREWRHKYMTLLMRDQ